MTERKCENWLKSLAELVGDTETPKHFWLWGGLFTISAALERRVWIDYGLQDIWPHLYVILVAPPGICRKGAPIGLARKMLQEIQCEIAADGTSKESITQEMSKNPQIKELPERGTTTQCPLSVISSEFSSIMAIDPKKMTEFLTDIYDFTGETWKYKTKHGDWERLYGPALGVFAATTPSWLAENIPYQTFGAGFFSRINLIVGIKKDCRIAWPQLGEKELTILKDMIIDLQHINTLAGVYVPTSHSRQIFEEWYQGLDQKFVEISDERIHSYIERAHVQVLKLSMSLSAAKKDELSIEESEMSQAIDIVEDIFPDLTKALGSMGRSLHGLDIRDIMDQLSSQGAATFSELLERNWRNIDRDMLKTTIDNLEAMGSIRIENKQMPSGRFDQIIVWKGEKR